MRSLGIGRISSLGLMSIGAALALGPAIMPIRNAQGPSNGYGRTRTRTTGPMGLNGNRECERRVRQIAAGSLRVENGLVFG